MRRCQPSCSATGHVTAALAQRFRSNRSLSVRHGPPPDCTTCMIRGVLAPGMKADVNIIDYAKINSSRPRMVADLPAGGKRLLQTATGYKMTIVNGVVTFENGIATGALPGKLLRSAPNAFSPAPVHEIAG